ncbi:MAG: 2-oxo acid dehydrogenase subunit E2, partial [Calditrichaeota bacterium]|nr:2-oxo acid dehydrogenase subunit E2 [Calditrichota bacterium]
MKTNLIDITMPPGDQETGKNILANWLAKEGDQVVVNEPLVEISTDKVNMEIAVPESGVLQEILIKEGTELNAGDILGRIIPGSESQQIKTEAKKITEPTQLSIQTDSKYRLSPVVKRLIKEHNIDVADLVGTAREGRINKADVLAYLEKPAKKTVPALENKFIPHNTMRKSIADHMVDSLLKTAPHVTSIFEMDLSAIITHRNLHKDQFKKEGLNLTYTSYFVYASVEALKAVPEVNSRFHKDGLELFADINIGVGTALEDKGLIVPVIQQAQNLSLKEIANKLQELTDKARQNKLQSKDVQ